MQEKQAAVRTTRTPPTTIPSPGHPVNPHVANTTPGEFGHSHTPTERACSRAPITPTTARPDSPAAPAEPPTPALRTAPHRPPHPLNRVRSWIAASNRRTPPQFGTRQDLNSTDSSQPRSPRVVALTTQALLTWTMRHRSQTLPTNPSRLRCTHHGLRVINVRTILGGIFAFGTGRTSRRMGPSRCVGDAAP